VEKRQTPKQKKSKEVRMKVYEYVKDKGGFVTVKDIETTLKLTHAVTYHHVTTLIKEKFLISKKVTKMRVTTLMVMACGAEIPKEYSDLDEAPAPVVDTPPHVRVVRLLDNPLPRPKESKKKTKVYVGSGMSLFNNY
jgi:hypothetical protein